MKTWCILNSPLNAKVILATLLSKWCMFSWDCIRVFSCYNCASTRRWGIYSRFTLSNVVPIHWRLALFTSIRRDWMWVSSWRPSNWLLIIVISANDGVSTGGSIGNSYGKRETYTAGNKYGRTSLIWFYLINKAMFSHCNVFIYVI